MALNIERLEKLRDTVRLEKHRKTLKLTFNMAYWQVSDGPKGCGTIACLGGTADLLRGVNDVECGGTPNPMHYEQTSKWLGMTEEQARALFNPTTYERNWSRITPWQAAKAVQVLIDTGSAEAVEDYWAGLN